jgi:hypothetical protein
VGSWKPPRTVAIAVLGASTLALAGCAACAAIAKSQGINIEEPPTGPPGPPPHPLVDVGALGSTHPAIRSSSARRGDLVVNRSPSR